MNITQSLYERISDLTDTEYNGMLNKDTEMVLVTSESIECMLINLLDKIDELYYEIGEIKRDMEDNYQPIPFDPYEEYCVSENDFH